MHIHADADSIDKLLWMTSHCGPTVYYAPPLIGGALSDTFVWRLSVTYIGPRKQRPRKTKTDTEVAHITHDSDTAFRVKRSRSPSRFGWLFKSLHNVYWRDQFLRHRSERATACRSWIFMAQSVLGAAGVWRVGYGLEVGRSVHTAGGAGRGGVGAYVSPRAQLVIIISICTKRINTGKQFAQRYRL